MDRRFLTAAGCLLLLAGCGPQGTADIQILTVSDWHGQLDFLSERDAATNVTTTYGGIGLLKVYLDEARAENPNTIFVTAGDIMGATPALSSVFSDKPAIEGMNYLGLELTTFGNHEFDSGIDNLKARMDEATFGYVSTNLTHAREELGTKPAVPYKIIEVGQASPKVKVAFLGITEPEAPQLSYPGVFRTMEIQDPVAATKAAAKDARAAGAAVVVVLVHMGATSKDGTGIPSGPAIDFASAISGVDLVVADHTDITVNGTFGNALVVENRSKGRTYSRIQISVKDGKVTGAPTAEIFDPKGTATNGTISCPTTACPDSTYACTAGRCVQTAKTPDPAAETLLQPYRTQLAGVYDGTATKTDGIFIRTGTAERTGEVPIGDLLTDAMLDRYRTSDGAQIAFTNGGGIRAPIPSSYAPQNTSLVRTNCSGTNQCDVVVGDIYTVLPFGNTMVVRKITGEVLWQALEHSVAQMPAADGRFLQISGFTFQWKQSNPSGSRVQSVTLLDAAGQAVGPIAKDSTEYTMVTNDFTNVGGDGYAMLKEATASASREVMADVLRDYVKTKTLISPSQYPGGRIVMVP